MLITYEKKVIGHEINLKKQYKKITNKLSTKIV